MTDAHHHRMQQIQYAEHDDNAECRSPGSTARNNQQRRNAGADRIECVHEVEPSGVPLRNICGELIGEIIAAGPGQGPLCAGNAR